MPGLQLVTRIERSARSAGSEASYFKKTKITELFVLDNGIALVAGTYFYVIDEVSGTGYEHHYFGVLSADKTLIQADYELLQVHLVEGKYYLITHFQKPESCARGLVIYRLEEDGLVEDYLYYKDNLRFYKLK